jgi:hypothetical protein
MLICYKYELKKKKKLFKQAVKINLKAVYHIFYK